MAGSQLKRLKASLREQGVVGPQQSKKQKRKAAEDVRGRNEKRLQRGVVLDGIREQFNPFDLKHAKGPKFEVTSNRPTNNKIKGRPGEAKAAAEEKRRQTLLVDMQHRHKVGGIIDQRFGENDPTMTPEEKAMERFAREQMRSHKKNTLFDLEDDEDDGESGGLTHGGKALKFDHVEPKDDFDEDIDDDEDNMTELDQQRRKRLRAMDTGDDDEEEEQPERKKTKQEVMDEIIAKSKMGKYERQQRKEEDEDLRMEIDQDLPELSRLLAQKRQKGDSKNDAKSGADHTAFDKSYDLQVRKLAHDRRAQPADRTKTDEEKAKDKQKLLEDLEEKRQKGLRGEEESEDDSKSEAGSDDNMDEYDNFGLGAGIPSQPDKRRPTATELGFDDEDDFVIDDDLVASGSDIDSADDQDDEDDEDDDEDGEASSEDDDDEFTKGLLTEEEARNPLFRGISVKDPEMKKGDTDGLPFTFRCSQTLEEFSETARQYPLDKLPAIIVRIRTLYHPRLHSQNKERLGVFAMVLVEFVSSPFGSLHCDAGVWPSFAVLESIIRHIHSLAKTFPMEVARACRQRLKEIASDRPSAPAAGDLMLLTLVGTIFPTSHHFHKTVVPAKLTACRYLGRKVARTLADYAGGQYLSILSLQYEQVSKRYVPEVVDFALYTICALSPTVIRGAHFRSRNSNSDDSLRISNAGNVHLRKLGFRDCVDHDIGSKKTDELKVALLGTALQTCDAAADLWSGQICFVEVSQQILSAVKHLTKKKCRPHLPSSVCDQVNKLHAKLERMLRVASLSRKPLELHHHRPLAIKRFIPKFEDNFDPNKHYDHDRERADLAKLKKEHKKERKGAMRELRKDANFMAREKLKVKVAKEAAHEKKMNRIVAEIQNEEGRETNEYEKEKRARKKAKTR